MAKLFSHHDPYRIHASLGVLALLHIIYRGYMWCTTGSSFPSSESRWRAVACAAIHALLHATSFIPPLPEKRFMSKPMIWPEFRVHNAIFGIRHAVATAVYASFLREARSPLLETLFVSSVVYGTSSLATWASRALGDPQKRTTNSMAYPAGIREEQSAKTKTWYANAQFGATFFAASLSPTCAFWPLVAIEIAPFMMTLVRKNMATTTAYHAVYSAALALPYLVYSRLLWAQAGRGVSELEQLEPQLLRPYLLIGGVTPTIVPTLRRRFRLSKVLALSPFVLVCFFCRTKLDALLIGTISHRICANILFALVIFGLVGMPFNELRWMFLPTNSKTPSLAEDAAAGPKRRHVSVTG